jgi:hypothetical protein
MRLATHKFLWKTKVPHNIKVFLWLTLWNSILTKDNLVRKGWHGDDTCHFCGMKETVDHLFMSCSVTRLIWSILQCASDFRLIPNNVSDLFGWLSGFNKEKKKLVIVGIAAKTLFQILWV